MRLRHLAAAVALLAACAHPACCTDHTHFDNHCKSWTIIATTSYPGGKSGFVNRKIAPGRSGTLGACSLILLRSADASGVGLVSMSLEDFCIGPWVTKGGCQQQGIVSMTRAYMLHKHIYATGTARGHAELPQFCPSLLYNFSVQRMEKLYRCCSHC